MPLDVHYDALVDEAQMWDEISNDLSRAGGTVTDLKVADHVFPNLPTVPHLANAYERARAHVQSILEAGERETEEIADALLAVRRDFQTTDDERRRRLLKDWSPE